MKTIAIIGSTGSIGTSSLKVIKKYNKYFKIKFLCANQNFKKLNNQYKLYNPEFVFLRSSYLQKKLIAKKNKIKSIEYFLKKNKKIDFIISAASGYESLDLNFKLLKIAKNLLIANKETIICGGKLFLKHAKINNCKILPIDSEHYCINFILKNFTKKKIINRFYLMASGGPFLKKLPKENVPLEKVLQHPNWSMGNKISVNSANMTNKIMELFEAHILFKINLQHLKIKVENSSKVHAIISLNNGLDIMVAHNTDMKIPIENSLFSDNITSYNKKNLSYLSSMSLQFQNPNSKIFPIISTGYKALRLGQTAMIIFTVLNDRLVEMFLNKKIKFNDISKILIKNFKKFKIVNYSKKDIRSLIDIKKTIEFAQKIEL